MDAGERLSVTLDFWDDTVGAFEPAKVLRQLQRAFPEVDVDPTDHQRGLMLREQELWSGAQLEPELREKLVRQSWNTYQTNGPSYRFVVPFPSDHRVSGGVSRFTVYFLLPPALPPDHRKHLLAFLQALRMGEPSLDSEADATHAPEKSPKS